MSLVWIFCRHLGLKTTWCWEGCQAAGRLGAQGSCVAYWIIIILRVQESNPLWRVLWQDKNYRMLKTVMLHKVKFYCFGPKACWVPVPEHTFQKHRQSIWFLGVFRSRRIACVEQDWVLHNRTECHRIKREWTQKVLHIISRCVRCFTGFQSSIRAITSLTCFGPQF